MDESAESALKIMHQWDWVKHDPDGNPLSNAIDISDAVSRLAMDGHLAPGEAVLELLCRDELLAICDFVWRSYRGGNYYSVENNSEPVKAVRWQALRDSMISEAERMDGKPYFPLEIDLPELTLTKCPLHEWEPVNSRCCMARRSPNLNPLDWDYSEEWFSAWNIEIWPRYPKAETDDAASKLPASDASRGGRPPAADWEAAALEMAGRYYCGKLKPERIADVTKQLASWLSDRGSHPSPSVLHDHAKRMFQAFRAWEDEHLKP
jgi:hypothetical protein